MFQRSYFLKIVISKHFLLDLLEHLNSTSLRQCSKDRCSLTQRPSNLHREALKLQTVYSQSLTLNKTERSAVAAMASEVKQILDRFADSSGCLDRKVLLRTICRVAPDLSSKPGAKTIRLPRSLLVGWRPSLLKTKEKEQENWWKKMLYGFSVWGVVPVIFSLVGEVGLAGASKACSIHDGFMGH